MSIHFIFIHQAKRLEIWIFLMSAELYNTLQSKNSNIGNLKINAKPSMMYSHKHLEFAIIYIKLL